MHLLSQHRSTWGYREPTNTPNWSEGTGYAVTLNASKTLAALRHDERKICNLVGAGDGRRLGRRVGRGILEGRDISIHLEHAAVYERGAQNMGGMESLDSAQEVVSHLARRRLWKLSYQTRAEQGELAKSASVWNLSGKEVESHTVFVGRKLTLNLSHLAELPEARDGLGSEELVNWHALLQKSRHTRNREGQEGPRISTRKACLAAR